MHHVQKNIKIGLVFLSYPIVCFSMNGIPLDPQYHQHAMQARIAPVHNELIQNPPLLNNAPLHPYLIPHPLLQQNLPLQNPIVLNMEDDDEESDGGSSSFDDEEDSEESK